MIVAKQEDLILIGGGGHCRSCIDVIETEGRFAIRGIVDANTNLETPILNYRLLGGEEHIEQLSKSCRNFLITIGQIKDWKPRVRLYEYLKRMQVNLPRIISPFAHVSQHATVGEGTIVMHHAVVNSGASLGHNCIVNSKALVEHDVSVGDHCHISTAAVVNGGTAIRRCSFVGSNAVIREGIEVGEDCVVGAGMVVMQSVASGSLVKLRYASAGTDGPSPAGECSDHLRQTG